jgi:hypothetical protein
MLLDDTSFAYFAITPFEYHGFGGCHSARRSANSSAEWLTTGLANLDGRSGGVTKKD